MTTENRRPPKGVIPPQLRGKGFDAHPENINKYGVPKDAISLRRMIQAMGNEEIEAMIGKGGKKKKVITTRFKMIIDDWFNSLSFDKQQAIMQYGIGKVADKLEVSGELKVIKVSLKKTDDSKL